MPDAMRTTQSLLNNMYPTAMWQRKEPTRATRTASGKIIIKEEYERGEKSLPGIIIIIIILSYTFQYQKMH